MKYSATSRRSSSRRSYASCRLNPAADSHHCASFAISGAITTVTHGVGSLAERRRHASRRADRHGPKG
jgi:hypothetical protein